ncbi:MAG TPA: UDP-N-acetylmuramoyl-L-alanyl-D-glutamate--2,6-diaminopimelate ligase [Candidatus Nitrosocosmicus sp.]|nr:UDP-N-acetylmuramoyl-L-alanyl-D-glutamate--2,6-diaminopimelate ligase [Candidatus Nitrosocosmicus sp.]
MWQTIKNIYHLFQAIIAGVWYRFPSKKLKLIGVTGTDGKTTTTNLIYHILHQNGYKVAMLSTVSAKIGDEDIDTGFHVTSPDRFLLNRLLVKMVNKNMEYAVLEATSHGLHQYRYFPLKFQISTVTNITHEHLDYHKTYENYVKAKAILFNISQIAVLNQDDNSYKLLRSFIKPIVQIVPYSYKLTKTYVSPLPGYYNQENTLAAATVCEKLGLSQKQIQSALKTFPGVVGRMDEISLGQKFRVIVDFAHTPNALEQLLKTLRSQLKREGQLIVVFGAAGERDYTKRPLMGKAASTYAHFSILTAEDPRSEKVDDITKSIVKGFKHPKQYHIEPDRGKAIKYALNIAKKDDIVVVTGKGHEKSMCFGKKEMPWSDKEEIVKNLSKIL